MKGKAVERCQTRCLGVLLCYVMIGLGAVTLTSSCHTVAGDQERVVEVPVERVVEVPMEVPKCTLHNWVTQGKYAVEAWGVPDNRYAVGEPLTIQMRTAAPAYVTMFHVSSSCKVTRLLDNVQTPMATMIEFPAKDSGLRIIVKPPSGPERFYVIATLEKLSFLSEGDILSESNGIAAIDMSPDEFYQRLEQVRARSNPSSWGLTTLRTEVIEH